MLTKIFIWYYRFQAKRSIKFGYWTYYSGLSGLFLRDKGLYHVVKSIKDGFFSSYILSINDKSNLLRDVFSYLVDYVKRDYHYKQVFVNFCDVNVDLIIRLARGNSLLLKDDEVRKLILSSKEMQKYRAELCQIWSIKDEASNFLTDAELARMMIGSKNSAPENLVKEMYDLQAKGCPVPPNKNKPNNNNDQ